ncbi:MAG: PPK2 family polyphosphate kinase [Propionibacterium freudenreichii]
MSAVNDTVLDDHPGSVRALLRCPRGAVDVTSFDAAATPGYPGKGRADSLEQLDALRPTLDDLEERFYANSIHTRGPSVLLVLQGMDGAGKGGTVRHVIGMVDPQGVHLHAFKTPTKEELAHDFLWRVRKEVPGAGQIGIFDRSHYEDVLIGRVNKLAAPDEIEKRYGRINEFEAELASHGTRVIKCFLNVSKDAQKKRFLARVNDPEKYYKFNPADLESRSHWDEYMQAYDLALSRCNEDYAPWYVIPCDHKWYRNWAITHLLIEEIEAMGLTWPPADFDVEQARRQVEAL